MTLDNITGITKGSWTVDSLFCKSQLITCNRVNECNGVCPFEDALKHADKEMDKLTVIDHDKDWIIGCIQHDGFIHTHRFDKANQIIHDALSAEAEWIPCSERLPECGFGLHYLVTLKDGHDFMDDVYEAFFDKYGWHVGDNELACDDIIAWMPLPDAYKEEKGEKND